MLPRWRFVPPTIRNDSASTVVGARADEGSFPPAAEGVCEGSKCCANRCPFGPAPGASDEGGGTAREPEVGAAVHTAPCLALIPNARGTASAESFVPSVHTTLYPVRQAVAK
eukprot:702713-Prymnesium_polylepis.1